MSKINVLDKNTVDKIAAGEVVDRPSSVVKELLENAIDAKATAITVEIKDGGISLIRITDNGEGISKGDIQNAFLRHATSKITSVTDLLSVHSLGFRGEALSSIAAVAQVECISKTHDELIGVRYVIEGGEEKALEEVGAPFGTTFIIRNLFYNTPARRKFLKTAATEASYISNIIERIALSHPDVSIRFITNSQSKLHTSGNGKLKDIIYTIFGRDICANTLEIDCEVKDMKLTGYIGKPVITRGNRNNMIYFINGRYIKSKIIYSAIEEAYKPYIMQHNYPFCVLHFEIDSSLIDVNVHPSKMEIRFENQIELFNFFYDTLSSALKRRELIPEVKAEPERVSKAKKAGSNLEGINPSSSGNIMNERNGGGSKNAISNTVNDGNGTGNNAANGSKNMIRSETILENENSIRDKDVVGNENSISNKDVVGNGSNTNNKDIVGNENNINNKDVVGNGNNISNKNAVSNEENANKIEPATIDYRNDTASQSKESIIAERSAKRPPEPFETKRMEQYRSEQAAVNELNHSSNDSTNAMTIGDNATTGKGEESDNKQLDLFDNRFLSEKERIRHKMIGQLFDTYWLIEYDNNLYIIDQHAAHEKVLYEKTLKQLKNKEFTSQQLNPPIILTLSMAEEELINRFMDNFNELGYEIEAFGGREYAVRAVPDNLYSIGSEELLRSLIDNLSENSVGLKSDLITERIASMSCKAAVKGNNRLSTSEADALIEQLLSLDNPYNCPHGRPTIISMSKYEIEKKFKRIL